MSKQISAYLSMAALALCAVLMASASTNTPPTLDLITNQSTFVDHPILVTMNAHDVETITSNLQLSFFTTNPTLITPEDAVFHYYIGDDGNWFVTLVPTFGMIGTATNTVTVSDGTNSVSQTFVLTVLPPPARSARFANTTAMTIPDSGPTTPYPTTINVTGMMGLVTNVHLTISKFAHTFPDDVHMMVVGPTGQPVVFWSHAGGGALLTNDTVTMVDGAPPLADEFEIWSEQLGPADYAANNPPVNNTNDFPFPAPGAPYTNAVAMSSLNGVNANGTWTLYVYDDFPPDHGMIAGGWSLMITTTGGQGLTVTGITASDKVYDGTNSATINLAGATLVGVTNGDIVSLVTTGAVASFSDKNVGSNKTVNITGLSITGSGATNYTLIQPITTAAITARGLTITGTTASNKVYDATNSATINLGGATLVGVTNGDIISLVTTGATGAFVDKNVGSNKTVTVSGLTLSGTNATNYALTQPTTTATITARGLTVSGTTAADKVYDSTNTATIVTNSATLVGVLGGDTVSLVTTGVSGAFVDKNVGSNKTVTVAGIVLGGTNATNYTVTQPTNAAAITPHGLTVKADDQSRPFGMANPVLTASYTGFAGTEILGTSGVTGTPALATSATITSPVSGSPYTITAGIGSLGATNYTFSFLSGLLTVTPTNLGASVVSSVNPSCPGSAVNFTATVNPGGSGTPTGTVQFKIDGSNFGSPVTISSNSATSGNITTLTSGGHAIAAVYSGDTNFNGTTSPNFTQTVNVATAAPTAGNDGPVCSGATVHLTASTVTNATYSWTGPNGFISAIQNPAVTNVTAVSVGVYSVSATVSGCVSIAGTTTVALSSAPSITGHSSGATKCVGDSITFTVTASGNGLTYQWLKNGTNINAATSTNYTIASIGTGDAGSYNCTVSGTCSPPATSDPAVLTVSPPAVGGTATATAPTVYTGDATTIALSGSTGSIQWQSSTDNVVFANMGGQTSSTVNTGPLFGTTYFQAVVTSSPCTATATSTVASVSVNSIALQITSIALQGNDLQITWTTARGHTNAVQAVNGNPGYSTNFTDISGPIIITGSGYTSTNYTDVGGATNGPSRFYRIRFVP